MRPIEFRAWDTGRKKMFSSEEMGRDELTINPNGRGFVNVHSSSTKLSKYYSHLLPLQFTGLLDKNGKKIFEGDIVSFAYAGEKENKHMIVKYDEALFALYDKYNYPHWILSDWGKKVEIIGNIYENPELLEAK